MKRGRSRREERPKRCDEEEEKEMMGRVRAGRRMKTCKIR